MTDLRFYDYRTQDLIMTVTEHERLMKARAAKVPEGQFLLPRKFLEEYAELLESSDKPEIYKMVIGDQVKAMLNKEG